MTFRGKLILIGKDFPFQCCSAESFPISKWISDISDRVKFLKWDEFVSIEFISTEHFFSDEELRLGATAALPELVTLIKRQFVLFYSPPHLACSIQDNRNQYYLRRMIVVETRQMSSRLRMFQTLTLILALTKSLTLYHKDSNCCLVVNCGKDMNKKVAPG